MLPLKRQEHYRARFASMNPLWQPATAIYEQLVRQYILDSVDATSHRIHVLDVGCGAGGILERLAAQIAWPYGIDADIASLHRQRASITVCAGDISTLPFRPAIFDLLICSWVLEHLANPKPAMSEIARVLKPGGRFIFLTPDAQHWLVRLNRLVPQVAQSRLVQTLYARNVADTFPVAYQLNTPASIRQAARAVGLQPVVITSIADPTYLAFNDFFFAASILLEKLAKPGGGIHIVGELVKT